MLICRNAEGVHGKRKVGNPWYIVTSVLNAVHVQGNGHSGVTGSFNHQLSISRFKLLIADV